MSTGYKIVEQDEIHFLTFQIVKWIDLFSRQVYRDIVIDRFPFYQKKTKYGHMTIMQKLCRTVLCFRNLCCTFGTGEFAI